ncbi:MAG TPA: acetylglutamate kinase [Candidatus Limnocylindrales bacterium]|nr:acetylglutamate kinase [Candidatus Limnocylindrales bacterium]
MSEFVVIKISGHELDDAATLAGLAQVVCELGSQAVIVHGGGKEITALQTALGIEPRYADGLRVTDAQSLAVVEMALCGAINKRVVRVLLEAGVDALGMSGVDRGLVRAHQMPHPSVDMQFTGEIESVNEDALRPLLDAGVTPVIAPVCVGQGTNYNVNADHVAGALAAALGASRLVFLSNVPGVLIDGALAARLTPAETNELIECGVITGGMIPKVKTALGALESGVREVIITNLNGLTAGTGTSFAD